MNKISLRTVFLMTLCAGILTCFISLSSCATNQSADLEKTAPAPVNTAEKTADQTTASLVSYPSRPPALQLYNGAAVNNPAIWGSMNVHDPAIYKDGNTYWIFSTDVAVGRKPTQGIQIRKSNDLMNWTYVGTALSGIPGPAAQWSGAESLWAPDVIKLGDTYYLYYSASIMYSQRSCIGIATAKKLEGPWTDQGIIIKSDFNTMANAIDPSVFFDHEGKYWMVYGSFAEGIFLLKMNPENGRPAEEGEGRLIATRGSSAGQEGPYIVYNPDFKKYYLFTSYDSLFTDYNMRVGRADSVEGPYLDIVGQKMTDYPYSDDVPEDVEIISANVGYKMMGSYYFNMGEGWLAPGHYSVLNDNGNWLLAHHARPSGDKNWPYLHIRKILWSDDGWPMPSPQRYAGEKEQNVPAELTSGQWEFLCHHRLSYEDPHSQRLDLSLDGIVTGELGNGSWNRSDPAHLTVTFKNADGAETVIKGKMIPSWDWERGRGAVVFAGIDADGQLWWGKRNKSLPVKK